MYLFALESANTSFCCLEIPPANPRETLRLTTEVLAMHLVVHEGMLVIYETQLNHVFCVICFLDVLWMALGASWGSAGDPQMMKFGDNFMLVNILILQAWLALQLASCIRWADVLWIVL